MHVCCTPVPLCGIRTKFTPKRAPEWARKRCPKELRSELRMSSKTSSKWTPELPEKLSCIPEKMAYIRRNYQGFQRIVLFRIVERRFPGCSGSSLGGLCCCLLLLVVACGTWNSYIFIPDFFPSTFSPSDSLSTRNKERHSNRLPVCMVPKCDSNPII